MSPMDQLLLTMALTIIVILLIVLATESTSTRYYRYEFFVREAQWAMTELCEIDGITLTREREFDDLYAWLNSKEVK